MFVGIRNQSLQTKKGPNLSLEVRAGPRGFFQKVKQKYHKSKNVHFFQKSPLTFFLILHFILMTKYRSDTHMTSNLREMGGKAKMRCYRT